MRLPGTGLAATIRLRLRRWAARHGLADTDRQPRTNNDTSEQGQASASTSSLSNTNSVTPAAGEEDIAGKRRWVTLASRRRLPPFIRKYAQHRLTVTMAQTFEQRGRLRDPDDNLYTRIPDGEHVRVPVIWLTELYTPTTLAGLLRRIPPLIANAHDQPSGHEDLVNRVRTSRRQGGGAWDTLPPVRPRGGPHFRGQIADDLPAGISAVTWGIYTLTSTVTAVTAAFHV